MMFVAESIHNKPRPMFLGIDKHGWFATRDERSARKFTTRAGCFAWIEELGLADRYRATPKDI